MNFNIKKIVTAACMATFLATSFMPGAGEAANGRMSLAQAQQQIKHSPQQKVFFHKNNHSLKPYPHYPNKPPHQWSHKHRPAMHTRGPVSQTWIPARHSPPHHVKSHGPSVKNRGSAFKPHSPMHPMPPRHHNQPGIRR